MNYLWSGMIIAGIIYAACTGNLQQVTQSALDSAKDAISLCITMLGVIGMWTGIMKIVEQAGLLEKLTRVINPVLTYLFPDIPQNHPARKSIATNMIANVLGLGWAATPAGLKAMEDLEQLEEDRRRDNSILQRRKGIASSEMCVFLIINISSLQIIPINIIAYRSQYGSIQSTAVVGPGLIATICSTLMAVIFCRLMYRKEQFHLYRKTRK